MGKYLDLDDVVAGNPAAENALAELRAENARLQEAAINARGTLDSIADNQDMDAARSAADELDKALATPPPVGERQIRQTERGNRPKDSSKGEVNAPRAPEQAHGDALAALGRLIIDDYERDENGNADDRPGDIDLVRRDLTASGVPYVRVLCPECNYEAAVDAQTKDSGWQCPECGCALASAPADGWKMVPVEPTEAMKEAGQGCNLLVGDDPMGDAYRAMIAAAPQRGGE